MKIVGFLLRFLPKNHISYLTGLLVHIKFPKPISTLLIKLFSGHYRINEGEAEKPIGEYLSIGDFFIRKLKPGIRPIGEGIVHPVDGDLTQFHTIMSGSLIQAKGLNYSLNKFMLNNESDQIFTNGSVLTYYLCPTDYHRTHSPVDGEIQSICYIPGKLWPVNTWSVNAISELFSVNERVVIWIKTELGMLAYVMVGATNVGKISLSFDEEVVTNIRPFRKEPYSKTYLSPIAIKKGEELGVFNMGSTVIAVYSEGVGIDINKVKLGPVQMGKSLQV